MDREKVKAEIGEPIIEDLMKRFERRETKSAKKGTRTNKQKMKDSQKEFAKLFADHYNEDWFHTPDSGKFATIHKGKMSKEEAAVLAGDCRVRNSLFVLEAKYGYEHIELWHLFGKDSDVGVTSRGDISEWLDQSYRESEVTGLFPLLIWRQKRKHVLAFFPTELLPSFLPYFSVETTIMCYDGFAIVKVEELLKLPKEKLFKVEKQEE